MVLLLLLLLCCLGFCFTRRRRDQAAVVAAKSYSIDRSNPAYGTSQEALGGRGGGMLGNDIYQGVAPGVGGRGAVANTAYMAAQPTYADVAPNPPGPTRDGALGNPTYAAEQGTTAEPTYGTALPVTQDRERAGALANPTYADAPKSPLVRSGTTASTLSHTEFRTPARDARPGPPSRESSLTNPKATPTATPRKPSATEPLYAEAPVAAPRPGYPPSKEPLYHEPPVAATRPGLHPPSHEPLYNEPPVVDPPSTNTGLGQYSVPMQFGGAGSGSGGPADHYASTSPAYLEGDNAGPTYMQAAPVEGEYMSSEGADTAGTLPRKKPSIAERRAGSSPGGAAVPSTLNIPGVGDMMHFDEENATLTPRILSMTPKSPGAMSRSSVI